MALLRPNMVAGIQPKRSMMTWIKYLLPGVPVHTIDLLTLLLNQDRNPLKILRKLQAAEFGLQPVLKR